MAVVQTLTQAAGQTSSAAPEDDSDPEAADTARLAALMPADETQLLYSICLHGRADLGLAPDEYAALTMVLLRLLAFKPHTDLAEKKTLNNPLATRSVVVQSAAPVATAATPVPAKVLPPAPPPQAPISVKAPALQPWEDAPADASVVPAGRVLPVHTGGAQGQSIARPDTTRPEHKAPQAPTSLAQDAAKIVAVPVRQQLETRADAVAAQAPAVLVPTEEGDFWYATVRQLIDAEAIAAMVRELALQSQLVARDTDQWLLRVERESLNQPSARERLGQALHTLGFGVKLAVEIGRVTDSPGRRLGAAAAQRQLEAEKIIFEDPFVQSMMRDFGAKIVPGSIKPL
jgi:DNA polymerase III subunit gamma/tau